MEEQHKKKVQGILVELNRKQANPMTDKEFNEKSARLMESLAYCRNKLECAALQLQTEEALRMLSTRLSPHNRPAEPCIIL